MPMNLILETDDGVSEFIVKPVDRKAGQRTIRRIAVDSQGRECSHVHLTADGIMLPSGCTADLYEDAADSSVEQKELLRTDTEGNVLRMLPATIGRAQRPVGPLPSEDVLECIVTRAYALTPISMVRDLCESLSGGDVYRVPFRPRTAVTENPAFLLANDTGIFLLRCEECLMDFLQLDQPIVLDDADDDEDPWDGWDMNRGNTDPGGEDEW